MKAYPDTSFLCALYRLQANSPDAAAYFAAMPDPLEVTSLLLYEFRQAVRFQISLHRHDPSKGYSREEGAKMLADLKADLVSGDVITVPAPWHQVHLAAERLHEGRRQVDRLHQRIAHRPARRIRPAWWVIGPATRSGSRCITMNTTA